MYIIFKKCGQIQHIFSIYKLHFESQYLLESQFFSANHAAPFKQKCFGLTVLVNGATHIIHHWEAGYSLEEVVIRSAGGRKTLITLLKHT